MIVDFRVDADFPTHPKTKKLIRRLGHSGVFWLLSLWGWARKHRPSGELTGMDAEAIADAAGHDGPAEAFAAVLLDCGWLELEEGQRYRLHDWRKRNPWAADAARREWDGRKGAHMRFHARAAKPELCEFCARCDGGLCLEYECTNGSTMVTPCLDHGHPNAPAPKPKPKPLNQSQNQSTPEPANGGGLHGEKPKSKKTRKSTARDLALESIVAVIETTRPGTRALVSFSALAKLHTDFGESGMRAAVEAVPDWSKITDVIPFLRGCCRKQLDRGRKPQASLSSRMAPGGDLDPGWG